MKLDPQWRQAYRWFSVHALALAGTLPGVWCSLPGEWRAIVPISYVAIATAITSVLGIAGRVVLQASAIQNENKPC
ncbi:hypothetical protein ACN9MB_09170 [Dyella kyungheensis]|uniref:DUF7940 domain-containing protein n=1 Tax=Dyella kyungheensis TaxID=1242174 RepID=UPI003CE91550